jgi:hypothetical protein
MAKKTKHIKRGEIIKRFKGGGFVFKGFSDRFAYSHPTKETKWFDTLDAAISLAEIEGGAR